MCVFVCLSSSSSSKNTHRHKLLTNINIFEKKCIIKNLFNSGNVYYYFFSISISFLFLFVCLFSSIENRKLFCSSNRFLIFKKIKKNPKHPSIIKNINILHPSIHYYYSKQIQSIDQIDIIDQTKQFFFFFFPVNIRFHFRNSLKCEKTSFDIIMAITTKTQS